MFLCRFQTHLGILTNYFNFTMSLEKKAKITEITVTRSRADEERFYTHFSETQLNAVLLLILGNTFFVQGASKFIDSFGFDSTSTKIWLLVMVSSLLFLVLSVGTITIGGIMSRLRIKRTFNLLSFIFFILGIGLFISSLLYIIVIFVKGY